MFDAAGATPAGSGFFCESSLELRDQSRQGFRLLIRGQMTAGQPLDLEPEFAQPFLREVHLPVFKGIFVAAAYQERELIAISLEEVTKSSRSPCAL